ncbi:ATP synthase F1 subcomplex delta subunit [Filimonas lacunae]|uniref:ATP synthase subunit delta n=1 Tax=Filimonas lacunae TaxID=477680 RepID=A0A173MP58_9BACT|nr:ATP synthase F1 subunit delta [Filimonas lacunae]BAV09158.1 ATP synthase delta chain [Filimonas lacunae]SIS68145.1 ATP synthase F1 subcomplex delta subunit [Filimonas lacunae]
MPNPRLAGRYAKSLVDLATEKGQLEVVYKDMQYLQAVCKSSREFVNLLRSPIIKADKKTAIIEAVTKGNVSELTNAFFKLLVNKGREYDLPEIADTFIDQYYALNNISKVKLTTAVAISDEVKNAIAAKVKADQGLQNVDLETVVDESLIGGFTLEFNNRLLDASVLRDLNDIKKQFSVNLFESRLK